MFGKIIVAFLLLTSSSSIFSADNNSAKACFEDRDLACFKEFGERIIASYKKRSSHKALSYSQSGKSFHTFGHTNVHSAARLTLDFCEMRNKKDQAQYPCQIVKLDDKWVDGYEPPKFPEQIDSIDQITGNAAKKKFEKEYIKAEGDKVFVYSYSGKFGWRASTELSIERMTSLSMENCKNKNKSFKALYPCKVINVNGSWLEKRSDAVIPTMALDTELTDDHINQFLKIMPSTSTALKSLQTKLASNEEANKKVRAAVTEGKMFRTVVEIASELYEITALETTVINSGYESIGDWAYIGDRIMSVFFVGEMLSAIASIPYADKGFEEGTNVFEFIADESNSKPIRKKLQNELEKNCAESCVVSSDLAVVGARIRDIAAAFEGL